MARVPECGHPESKHQARGLCVSCYSKWRIAQPSYNSAEAKTKRIAAHESRLKRGYYDTETYKKRAKEKDSKYRASRKGKATKSAYKKSPKYQAYLSKPRTKAEAKYRVGLHRGADLRCELPILRDRIYARAIEFYLDCPENKVVDHIIPLNNIDVCGLHVHWNLQYLTITENYMKGNINDGTYNNDSWKNIRIKCITTGDIFKTKMEASKAYGIDPSSISKVLNGIYKQTKGYKFEYITEINV